jgi:hypothetical protein
MALSRRLLERIDLDDDWVRVHRSGTRVSGRESPRNAASDLCGMRHGGMCHASGAVDGAGRPQYPHFRRPSKGTILLCHRERNGGPTTLWKGKSDRYRVERTDCSVQVAVDDLLGDDSQFHVVIASMMAHPGKGLLNLQPTSPDQDSLGLLQNALLVSAVVSWLFSSRASNVKR